MHAPSGDPNFPTGLSILPSTRSVVKLSTAAGGGRGGQQDAEEDDETAAQDIAAFGIAGRTWEAAYLLRHYLTPPSLFSSPPLFDPPCSLFPSSTPSLSLRRRRTILELGSGTGFLSLSFAPHLPPSNTLILTDLENVCPLLSTNLSTARQRWAARSVFSSSKEEPEVLVRPLPWGDANALETLLYEQGRTPDVVLASDLIYFEFLYAPLLRTLIGLTERSESEEGDGEKQEDVEVIFSYKVRSLSKEQPFWEAFGRWFHFEPVLLGTPLAPSPPSFPSHSSSPSPSPLPPSPPKPLKLAWTRFGSFTPSSSSSSPGSETDEFYVFICRRWPDSLGMGGWERLEELSDEELLQGRGAGRGYEAGGAQFEEMLLREVGVGEW
ncbi:hypothetical protein JCM8547_001301 [Rhodosporidiobolus lusitaniae]